MIGSHSYFNDAGQDIWWVDGTPCSDRPVKGDVRALIIHHTDGTDSREYFITNTRPVSTHYLIGMYPDCVTTKNPKGIRVYKYASEANTQTYCQGFGVLGGEPGNPNGYGVSLEIEWLQGQAWDMDLLREAAKLARSIIDGWQKKGHDLVVIGHKHIDPAKQDPNFEWTGFMEMVYGSF